MSKYYVYKFINGSNEIIYIGKAKTMSSRMSGHNHLPKECYDEISKIEYLELNNHSEGSIYEIYYINKYSPKYNIVDNRGDDIGFELPEKEWKVWGKKVTYKKEESKELIKKIKEHRLRGDIVRKIKGVYYVYKKERIDRNKHKYETLLNTSYVYYEYDSLFKALFYHDNISEVCRHGSYYYNKNLKYNNGKVWDRRFNMKVRYSKIFICYNSFDNVIFIHFGQENYISLHYKGIKVEDIKEIINNHEGYDKINFRLEDYDKSCFCEEEYIESIMEEFRYLINNKEMI